MIRFNDIKREAGFVFGHRQIKLTLLVVFLLSSVSLWSGYSEMQEQQATIERLLDKDETERNAVLTHQSNYGMVAYYAFHLTYAPPSPLAFAAVGERDVFPWKHRISMLALEGQIYESDTDNPELAFLGRWNGLPLKRHRNVPNLELNNQVNKVRRPRWILQRLGWI